MGDRSRENPSTGTSWMDDSSLTGSLTPSTTENPTFGDGTVNEHPSAEEEPAEWGPAEAG